MISHFDTQLAGFLLNSNAKNPTLPELIQLYLGHTLSTEEEENTGLLAQYLTLLKPALEEALQKEHLWDLYSTIEAPLADVLLTMEKTGVKIDQDYLHTLSKELHETLNQLEKDIYVAAGEEFTINSPKQLQHILFTKLGLATKKKTKTGFSTDVSVLEELAAFHVLPQKILDYRHIQKLLSTYIDALPLLINKSTGRVHSTFNQTTAATGRLSSLNPNLQNIPIRTDIGKKIRKAFIAEEEFHILSADYSQIELRMFAHFSQDPALLSAFHEDGDVHTRTAALVFGKKEEEISPTERRYAKTINFGIIYGMGAFRLSNELSIPLFEAKQFIERYFETYSGVKTYIDTTEQLAREQGYLTTLFGRKRAFPELQSSNKMLYEAGKREAINFPLQGSAADIIKKAMINIHEIFKEKQLQSRMILQVHDELLFEVHYSEREEVTYIVKNAMEQVTSLSLPLKVELGYGTSWLDAH